MSQISAVNLPQFTIILHNINYAIKKSSGITKISEGNTTFTTFPKAAQYIFVQLCSLGSFSPFHGTDFPNLTTLVNGFITLCYISTNHIIYKIYLRFPESFLVFPTFPIQAPLQI